MQLRPLLLAAGVAAGALASSQALADPGQATRNVNMRECASTRCARILTIPAGAIVEVVGQQGSWYEVQYRRIVGFAFAPYIALGGYYEPPVYPVYPEPYYYEYDYPYYYDNHRHDRNYRHDDHGHDHGGREDGGNGPPPYVGDNHHNEHQDNGGTRRYYPSAPGGGYQPNQGHGNEPGGLCAPGDIQCNR